MRLAGGGASRQLAHVVATGTPDFSDDKPSAACAFHFHVHVCIEMYYEAYLRIGFISIPHWLLTHRNQFLLICIVLPSHAEVRGKETAQQSVLYHNSP